MAMKTIVFVSVLLSLVLLQMLHGALAVGCPFSGRSRSLLQVASPVPTPVAAPVPPTPAPATSVPSGLEPYDGALLNYNFYDTSCPSFQQVVTQQVTAAVALDALAPGYLTRLFFHDCFVQGCDGSVLLNSTVLNLAEKDQAKSVTLQMFWVIDTIKAQLETACPGVVSCADIIAAAAVQAIIQSGGPAIYLPYGRRDALDSFATQAQTTLPGGFLHVEGLIENFANQGLNVSDIVALSGGHTLGQTRCSEFVQDRFAISGNNPFPDTEYGQEIYSYCLEGTTAGIDRKVALDANTTTIFDNGYFQSLVAGRGILVSDQDLYSDPRTTAQVKLYATNQQAFFNDFAVSLLKMSKINVLTGTQGQVRKQCWVRNTIDKVADQYGNFEFDPISPTFCIPAACSQTPTCASS